MKVDAIGGAFHGPHKGGEGEFEGSRGFPGPPLKTNHRGAIIIARPGYSFIGIGLGLLILGWLTGWAWLALLGLLAGGFFAYFFRDPERAVPSDENLIVSPADGKVVFIDEVTEERWLKAPARRVAIFMNVFDVHVNRAPVAAQVIEAQHRPGRFMAAFRHEAHEVNEQYIWELEGEGGRRVLMVQIAGLLARRIIAWAKTGETLNKGQRLGMICFGSRVDVYLPAQCQVAVQVGDKVRAGADVIGRWGSG